MEVDIKKIIEVLTFITAIIAIGFSYVAFLQSKKSSKTDVFLSLRGAYTNIHSDLPMVGVRINDTHRKALEKYWFNAYNEWYVTNIICPKHNLWDEFFAPAISGALSREGYKEKIELMISNNICFGETGLRDKFLESIGVDVPTN